MGLESQLEGKLARYAKSRGCLTYKFSSPANRGVPDRIFIGPTGAVLFLEVKAPGKKPTALQSKHLADINRNKCSAEWADNFEDGRRFIEHYLL